jgi:phospholipase/lecithinase/hemolysin
MANARVVASPDAAGNAATLTLKQQIDSFLAGKSFAANDVVLLNGGTGDLIAQMNAVTAGTQTPAQMLTNATQAGADLASQVRRLVGAGAKFVVVTGAYNMGNSPWAASIGQNSQLTSAAINFNTGLLTNIVDLGANVLYVDMSYYMNLIVNQSPTYLGSGANASTPACTSVDAGAGIGIGTGKVNANLCNVNTIAAGVDYTVYAFADPVYFGPKAQRAFGDYAYSKMKIRW